MSKMDDFFYRVLNNETLVDCLSKLEYNKWEKLMFNEKVKLFSTIIEEISGFYPELGTPHFEFVFLEDGSAGEDSVYGTFINVKMLEDGNHFEILASSLHELRHYFQRKAGELYKEKGIVHEMFTKEEIESFIENQSISPLYLASNYIEKDDVDKFEYYLQPIEYDAENFSFEFMKRFSKKFLKDKYDVMNCGYANAGFDKVKKIHDGNSYNIIDFDKIYSLNYYDLVRENRVSYNKEKVKYEECMKLLDNMNRLSDSELLMLLAPCFMDKYDDEIKVKLINCYLTYNDCESKVEYIDGSYYFNDLIFDLKEVNVYKMLEPIFLAVAAKRIENICKKDLKDLKFGYEKEIKINLLNEKNVIEEEENPLFYKLQPFILYRNSIVRDEYHKYIRSVDNLYDSYDNYFFDFVNYLKKYDNSLSIKKAEILLDKNFEDIYKEMLEKMKANLNNERKTCK